MTGTTVDDALAQLALDEYDVPAGTEAVLINLSENATYLLTTPDGGSAGVLRVHREGYHDADAIASELAWLDALREDAGVSTPQVLPARDGRRVVTLAHDGTDRHLVLFERVAGTEPDEDAVGGEEFRTLGALTARLHRHARDWRRPSGFSRFSWDWEHSLGDSPRWGRWQDGIGIGRQESELLDRLVERLRDRLTEYGDDAERFGLVHADLRLANLLVDAQQVNVIDFDDCGFSWFLYDFGASVSFIEDDPRLPEWQSAWVAGYREVAPLSAADEEMLASFVMLRRMLLVAWMGSHSHSRECQEKGPSYAVGTCLLAERYLASDGRSL